MNPASFQTAPPRTIADMRFLDRTTVLLPFRNSVSHYVHVQTGILGLEPTARFYGSCFLPIGKVFRRGPDHAIRVFGLRRFSANENPWTFLVSNQGPTAYEAAALTTELKVQYRRLAGRSFYIPLSGAARCGRIHCRLSFTGWTTDRVK